MIDINLPLIPGRGYSITLEDSVYKLNHPAILVEGRVAITPMGGNRMRFGGTMEVTSTRMPPRINRVKGILNSAKNFSPSLIFPSRRLKKYGMDTDPALPTVCHILVK